MKSSEKQNLIEEKIVRYVNGRLSEAEVEDLWVDLLGNPEYIELVRTAANLKAVVENKDEEAVEPARVTRIGLARYAAAAVVVIALGMFAVFGLSPQPDSPRIIMQMEYYSSERGGSNTPEAEWQSRLEEYASFAEMGEFTKAVEGFESLLADVNDDNVKGVAFENLAALHFNQDQFEAAAEYYRNWIAFERASGDNVDLDQATWFLAHTALRLNKTDEAVRLLNEVVTMESSNANNAQNLLKELK